MSHDWITQNYDYLERDGLYIQKGYTSIAYSDGHELERKIYRFVKHATDRSTTSNELHSRCTDWATTYHLNPGRSNLLRPFEGYLRGKNVLELGCGCGAITRFLGESKAKVVAVEGSAMRASIAARRCEELKNVTVLCEKILDLPCPKQQFDVVTLIGVLEYARLFSDTDDPIQSTLECAQAFLKPGGCLFLAIENRFGLKYFAGGAEDHLGHPMAGIQGEYTDNSPATFSRKELTHRLNQAGFTDLDLHLPFPDYKLPTLMVHPSGITDPDFVLGALLQESVAGDVMASQYRNFSMQAAWPGVHDAGLTPDLANSFLFVCWKQSSGQVVPQEDLARYYGQRVSLKEYMKEVLFRREGEDIKVRRRKIVPDGSTPKGPFNHVLEDEDYVPAQTCHNRIVQALSRLGWGIRDFAEAVRPWVHKLQSLAQRDETGQKVVSGRWYDLIPANALDVGGDIIPFDQEWAVQGDRYIPLEFLVFRGLYFSVARLTTCSRPRADVPYQTAAVCGAVMMELGLEFDAKHIAACWVIEGELQKQILGTAHGVSFEQVAEGELPIRFDYEQLMAHIGSLQEKQKQLKDEVQQAQSETLQYKEKVRRLEHIVEKLHAGLTS